MTLNKFIQSVKHCSERISLYHVILISCLFALVSIINHNGGVLNPEMYLRLPFYLSDTPLLNKLFDSKILDQDYFRARELSYLLDFVDSKFIEFSIENGFPHFLSFSHYLFSILISCLLWSFCVKELKLKPLIGIGLVVLFWTSPSVFLGGDFFRTGKMGVALSIAILFYVIYKIAVTSKKGDDFQISGRHWIAYSVTIFIVTFLDEQGLFFAITTLLSLTAWCLFVRNKKNLYIMIFIGATSVLIHLFYRYTIAPHLTFMINGYWPDFDYQQFPVQLFINNIGSYLSAGFFLYAETFRFLIGNPSPIVGFGLLLLFIVFPLFYYLYASPGMSSNDKKFFMLTTAALFITNFILIILMIALMVLRHPPLLTLKLTYYWLPINVLLVMTLAIYTDVFYKSCIPKWVLLVALCFAISGNILALSKHRAASMQNPSSQSRFSLTLISALKDIDSLNKIKDPLIKDNTVIEFFEYKKKIPPVDANAYQEKADYYSKLGQYRRAIENLNAAIIHDPNDYMAHNDRGNLYSTIRYFQNAFEDYNTSIRLNPNFAAAYINRGNIYTEFGQFQKAINDYNKVIHLNPNRIDVYKNRGMSFLLQGNRILGCHDLQKACELGDCKMIEEAKLLGYCR